MKMKGNDVWPLARKHLMETQRKSILPVDLQHKVHNEFRKATGPNHGN